MKHYHTSPWWCISQRTPLIEVMPSTTFTLHTHPITMSTSPPVPVPVAVTPVAVPAVTIPVAVLIAILFVSLFSQQLKDKSNMNA